MTETTRPRDWLDDILGADDPQPTEDAGQAPGNGSDRHRIQPWWTRRHTDLTAPADDEDDEPDGTEDEPAEDTDEDTADGETAAPQARWRPQLRIPATKRNRSGNGTDALVAAPAPSMALIDVYARTPRRIRWLAYHATAAGAGWRLGWVQWSTNTAGWIAHGHYVAPSAIVLYVIGGLLYGLYRRTRTWAWPAAWAAAIPLSSVTVGVLLYGA